MLTKESSRETCEQPSATHRPSVQRNSSERSISSGINGEWPPQRSRTRAASGGDRRNPRRRISASVSTSRSRLAMTRGQSVDRRSWPGSADSRKPSNSWRCSQTCRPSPGQVSDSRHGSPELADQTSSIETVVRSRVGTSILDAIATRSPTSRELTGRGSGSPSRILDEEAVIAGHADRAAVSRVAPGSTVPVGGCPINAIASAASTWPVRVERRHAEAAERNVVANTTRRAHQSSPAGAPCHRRTAPVRRRARS